MEVKPGYKLTEVGVMPEDWEVKKLGELSSVLTGTTPPTDDKSNYGNEYMFVGPSDLGQVKHIEKSEKMLSSSGFSKAVEIPASSIMITCIGIVGKVGIATAPLATNQQINSITPDASYDADFLYYTMLHYAPKLRSTASIQVVPIINKTSLSSFEIPFPTLTEQKIICKPINEIDLLITSLQKLIIKKQLIKQGVMQELLTGKRRLPGFTGEWEKTTIDECFTVLRGSGLSKAHLTPDGANSCILYGELFTTYNDVIDVVYSSTNSHRGVDSKAGDILLPGSTTTTGVDLAKASALLQDNVRLGGDINILRPKREMDSAFLAMYLNVVRRKEIARETKGITIYHLQSGDIKNIIIELPDLSEQVAISTIIRATDLEIRSLEKQLSKYALLKQAMMQELLTGRIRLL
jgi:type I restriction enzyme S subunit